MKRIFSALVLTVLLGAGCMPTAEISSSVPSVPIEPATATTTMETPSVPDFAKDWLSYTSRQFGFSFAYPKAVSGRELQTKQIDLGTAVENPGKKDVPTSWMELKLLRSDDTSLQNHYFALNGWPEGEQTDVHEEMVNGLTWYVHEEDDAGAGNYYHTVSYVTLIGYTHVVLVFTTHSVACENYGDDWEAQCVKFDEARDTALFHQIIETYQPKL